MAQGSLFKRAAAYRKKHKGMTMPEAVKALSSGKVSGAPRKTLKAVAGVKKRKHKAIGAARPKAKRIGATPGRVLIVKSAPKKHSGPVEQAKKIVTKINSMEVQYKAAKTRDMKDILALAINAEHRKLNTIKQTLKRR